MSKTYTNEQKLALIDHVFQHIPPPTVDLFATVIQGAQPALRPFSVGGHAVIPGELAGVAEKLRSRLIKAYWYSGYSNAAAIYIPGGAFLFLPRGVLGDTQMVWASGIVHEAVHCSADLRGQRRPYHISAFVDETAAHLAQALFLIHFKIPITELQEDDSVLKAAFPIAERIASGETHGVSASVLASALAEAGYSDESRPMRGLAHRS
jgi:hypothetical protein